MNAHGLKTALAILLALELATLDPSSARAQSPYWPITLLITVYAPSPGFATPYVTTISGALVKLRGPIGPTGTSQAITREAVTNDQGVATFSQVPTTTVSTFATYSMEISASGYATHFREYIGWQADLRAPPGTTVRTERFSLRRLDPGEVAAPTVIPRPTGAPASTTVAMTSTPQPAATPAITPTPEPAATPTPTPRANRTSGCRSCPALAGEPVDTSTGEYILGPLEDLDLGGPLPLSFSRYYASLLKEEGLVNSALGPNWMHNFDYYVLLENDVTQATVVYDRGNFITFKKGESGGVANWEMQNTADNREGREYQLRQDGGGDFWFMDPRSSLVYRFGPVGGEWRLLRVMDRNDNSLTLNYDGASQRLSQVSDGLGRTLTFGYDGSGRLAQVGDGVRTLSYSYADGLLAGYTDALGNVAGYEYDARTSEALLTSVRQPRGNIRHTQGYDADKRVVQQTDALGSTTTLSYDATTGVTTITDPLGIKTNKHEDGRVLVESTDALGQTVRVTRDSNDRSTSVTSRLGNTTTMGYEAETGLPATMTDARGSTGGFQYTSQVQLFGGVEFAFRDMSRVDSPDGSREELAFDARGKLIQRRDPAGNTTTYTYNSRGQMLTETNPLGGVVTSSYNPDGTLASVRDSETGSMTYEYDGLKRVTKANWPDGSSLRTQYNQNNRVLSQSDENGGTTSYSYDANGNLLTVIDALGQATRYEYDLMDRPVRTTDRLGKVSTASYTFSGRTATWTDPNGNTTTYGYDGRGRLVQVTEGGGERWLTGYDGGDRKTSETTPLGRVSQYQYDAGGNMTGRTTPLGHTSTFDFDERSRRTSVVDPLGRTVQLRYDPLGYLAGITPFGLGSASYARDPFGQLSALSDLRGKNWSFTTTPMGRAATSIDPLARRTSFDYDNRARPSRVTHPTGETQTFTYDPTGNVTRIQHSDGTDIASTYDALGRLASTDGLALDYDAESNVTGTRDSGVDFGATYDDGSRLKTVTYNNGAFTVTYRYDRRNNLVGVADSLTGTALTFGYDDDGRLTDIGRSNGVATTYTWDAGNRITRLEDGALGDQQYGYNAAGEVTRARQRLPMDAGSRRAQQPVTLTYDDAGQVNAAGYAYDARGRMTSAPGRSFTWDGASRLTAVGGATLGYNGLGDLRRREEGGTTVRYYYNRAIGMNPIVAEQQEGGAFLRYYVWTPDGNLLYLIDAANGNRVYFYHFDQYGSTLFLTDGAAAVTDSYAYTPYGMPLARQGANPQPFTFLGRLGVRQEGDGGLYHMRARYYDALTARFLSRDSAWPRVDSWAGLNPYLYARANPLKFVDPTGRSPTFLVSWIIKAVAKISEKAAGRLAMKAISKGISITAQEGLKYVATNTAMSAAQAEMDRLKDKVVDAALESLALYEAKHSGDWGDFGNDLLDPTSVFRDARDVSDLYAIVDVLAAVERHEQGADAGMLLHAIEAAVSNEESLSQGSLYSGKVGRAAMELVLAQWAAKNQKDLEELFCMLEEWGIDTVDELLFFLRTNGQHPSPDVNSPQSNWWMSSGRIRAFVEFLRQRGSRAAIVVLFDERQRRKSAPQEMMW